MKIFKALALSLLVSAAAFGQNAGLMPVPNQQFLSASGIPLAGGLIYTCVAGTSCPGNPLASYTSSTAGTTNSNPVVLDSGGFASIWLGSAAYKIVAQDVNGVTQWTIDGVQNLGLAALSGASAFPTLTVTGNASVGGNLTATTLNVNGATSVGAASATSLTTTGAVTVGTNETIAGTLGVTGALTASSTAAITGNTTVGGTLGVTGAGTVGGTLTVSGSKITLGGLGVSKIQVGAAGNTDLAGLVGLSGGTGSYTFQNLTYTNPPYCVATDSTANNSVKVGLSTTAITFTGTGSDFIAYICIARN
jgi:hypothetical protein